MGLIRKRKDKTPKIIRSVQEMSDEEFISYYKKYYVWSAVRISFGVVLFIGGVVLIILML